MSLRSSVTTVETFGRPHSCHNIENSGLPIQKWLLGPLGVFYIYYLFSLSSEPGFWILWLRSVWSLDEKAKSESSKTTSKEVIAFWEGVKCQIGQKWSLKELNWDRMAFISPNIDDVGLFFMKICTRTYEKRLILQENIWF